ncbi:MAG: hypothetical protein B6D64_10660 [Bacteroidetes bacterium 4484_276]|nr:MAG: hypothetical protein B6D64_10660 [Bacteroidetes bacterium 4484_276]
MNKIPIIILLITLSKLSIAQESINDTGTKRNNLFIELWGKPALLTTRIGFAYFPSPSIGDSKIFSIPVSISTLLGKKDNKIEFGISSSYNFGNDFDRENSSFNSLIIGYRIQPINNHIMIRVSYLPTFYHSFKNGENEFLHMGGFSFGYSF